MPPPGYCIGPDAENCFDSPRNTSIEPDPEAKGNQRDDRHGEIYNLDVEHASGQRKPLAPQPSR